VSRSDHILCIDWKGATIVGIVTVSLHKWLSLFGGLPPAILVGIGLTNLSYAGFSFSLWIRPARSSRSIAALVVANLGWSVVCICLLLVHCNVVTSIAVLHLGGEAVYVGALAIMEWRHRMSLVATPHGTLSMAAGRQL